MILNLSGLESNCVLQSKESVKGKKEIVIILKILKMSLYGEKILVVSLCHSPSHGLHGMSYIYLYVAFMIRLLRYSLKLISYRKYNNIC